MDIKLHYIEKGSGAPLIFLHGNGENGEYFKWQTEYFSQSRRIIAPDTRGQGLSPRGTAPFTIEQFAEDLHGLLLSLNIEKADILGFSDGANIALRFALEHPEMVNSLILNGGNLYPSGVKLSVQLPIYIGYGIASFFSLFDKKAVSHRELLGLMAVQPHVAPESLASISVPTMVIAGERDMIRSSHTELIASSIPGAELVILPGDHFIANKNSAYFNRAVDGFLNRHGLPSAYYK